MAYNETKQLNLFFSLNLGELFSIRVLAKPDLPLEEGTPLHVTCSKSIAKYSFFPFGDIHFIFDLAVKAPFYKSHV